MTACAIKLSLTAATCTCMTLPAAAPAMASSIADQAIASFNAVCFKAGQTAQQARKRMQTRDGTPLPYRLTFWDKTLEPAPGTPAQLDRHCEVSFSGDHRPKAISALKKQMTTPPVFGFSIDLPETHRRTSETAFIEGRELLRGRVAVVQVGLRSYDGGMETFMNVERLTPEVSREVGK